MDIIMLIFHNVNAARNSCSLVRRWNLQGLIRQLERYQNIQINYKREKEVIVNSPCDWTLKQVEFRPQPTDEEEWRRIKKDGKEMNPFTVNKIINTIWSQQKSNDDILLSEELRGPCCIPHCCLLLPDKYFKTYVLHRWKNYSVSMF